MTNDPVPEVVEHLNSSLLDDPMGHLLGTIDTCVMPWGPPRLSVRPTGRPLSDDLTGALNEIVRSARRRGLMAGPGPRTTVDRPPLPRRPIDQSVLAPKSPGSTCDPLAMTTPTEFALCRSPASGGASRGAELGRRAQFAVQAVAKAGAGERLAESGGMLEQVLPCHVVQVLGVPDRDAVVCPGQGLDPAVPHPDTWCSIGRMTVEVDRESIAKAWRKARGEEFYFEFRPSRQQAGLADADVLRSVEEEVGEVNEAAVERYGLDDAPFVEGASDSDHGVTALMNPGGEDDEVTTWFTLLAQRLTALGWAGSIRAARVTGPPTSSIDEAEIGYAIGAFARFTPWAQPHPDPKVLGVDLSEEDLSALAEQVDQWNARRTDRVYLARGDVDGLAPAKGLGAAWVRAALRNQQAFATWVDRTTHTTASAALTAGAEASFTIASKTEPWHSRLEKTTHVLEQLGPRLEVGAIRLTQPYASTWTVLNSTPPTPPGRIASVNDVRLARKYTLDAYGTQVLTGHHLQRAHDLSDWTITSLGNDRHLVQHPDPEAWYAHDTPDLAILAAARHDFGDLIVTEEIYRAFMTEELARRQQS